MLAFPDKITIKTLPHVLTILMLFLCRLMSSQHSRYEKMQNANENEFLINERQGVERHWWVDDVLISVRMVQVFFQEHKRFFI